MNASVHLEWHATHLSRDHDGKGAIRRIQSFQPPLPKSGLKQTYTVLQVEPVSSKDHYGHANVLAHDVLVSVLESKTECSRLQ